MNWLRMLLSDKKTYLVAGALLGAAIAGCASTPSLVITGEGLKAVGSQFTATSTVITQACIAKTLTVATCDQYRTFERKFKLAFPPAILVQETAMTFGDKTMAQNAMTILTGLVRELGTFTAMIGGK
jgi:hypothetical protein